MKVKGGNKNMTITQDQKNRLVELRAKDVNTLTPAEKTEVKELEKVERESK